MKIGEWWVVFDDGEFPVSIPTSNPGMAWAFAFDQWSFNERFETWKKTRKKIGWTCKRVEIRMAK